MATMTEIPKQHKAVSTPLDRFGTFTLWISVHIKQLCQWNTNQYMQCVYDTPGKISTKVETLDVPEPGPGECLIRLTHSGVCHSDLGIMENSVGVSSSFMAYSVN